MLTKDLIRCRSYKGKVCPQFIDVNNSVLLQLAEQLISIYSNEGNPTRCEIGEYAAPVINTAKDLIFVKGLNKLLIDRSEFSHEEGVDYCSQRKEIFLVSGELLKRKGELDCTTYSKNIVSAETVDEAFFNSGIYPDLPERERLILFKSLSAKNLLERYNCSLVQSLLLSAKSITLILKEKKAAKIRQMFRYLKFFRLLSKITRDPVDVEAGAGEAGAGEASSHLLELLLTDLLAFLKIRRSMDCN